MPDSDRRARAVARQARVVLRKSRLQATEEDLSPVWGAEAVSLVYRLSREAWSLSGMEEPSYSRPETPCRFVPSMPR
jgi:hypothetical protein